MNGAARSQSMGVIGLSTISDNRLSELEETCQYLLERTDYRPKIAIICGTGLGTLTEELKGCHNFPYEDVPHCVASSVKGHVGRLVFGTLAGVEVVCMQGRIHSFEGHPMWKMTYLVRVFAAIGVKVLIVTNAAGGLNPDFKKGDVMIIKDHLNLPGLAGLNPLIGLNDDRFGPRFPALTQAYDRNLRRIVRESAKELGLDFIKDGVYCYQTGPCFESVTESRLMRLAGVDVAGMSTVPEVLVAVHCNMRVLGFSIVTNMCVVDYDDDEKAEHDDILSVGISRTMELRRLLTTVLPKIATTITTNGTVVGIANGATNGTTNGTTKGTTNGTTKGTTNGSTSSTSNDTTSDATNGTTNSTIDDITNGNTKGTTNDTTSGPTNDIIIDIANGNINGTTNGITNEITNDIINVTINDITNDITNVIAITAQ
jgi:purine-nucleoside phosphorylase